MRISTLLSQLPLLHLTGSPDVEVTGLYYDSRQVQPGGAFFALKGAAADGHLFIPEAIRRGAQAVIMETATPLPDGVTGALVHDARLAMALVAARFYADPTAKIPVAGVTGTNGKTTVSYLIEAMLQTAGRRPAVLGTVNYRCGAQQLPAPNTTPESVDLQRTVAEFCRLGAASLVLEVSSHALDQQRVAGIHFDVAVFTNLTPEHLDYHRDMAGYFASKRRLFSELLGAGQAVINIDDPYGRRLAQELPGALTCGSDEGAAIRLLDMHLSASGIRGRVVTPQGDFELSSPLIGRFNVANLLCAIGAGLALGLPLADVAAGACAMAAVPGRMERIDNALHALVLVDYAHTPDALEKALTTLRELEPQRLITVFGCGGDRDRSKRPRMGEIAARLADLVILTSDNPRSEEPAAILEQIRAGVATAGLEELTDPACGRRGSITVTDRREALTLAVDLLQPGDLLLVAGKGHEDYQIIGTQRLHFDDRDELRAALRQREGGR